MYRYEIRRGIFEIYHVVEGVGTKTGECFYTKEEARKRVYELNGWNNY